MSQQKIDDTRMHTPISSEQLFLKYTAALTHPLILRLHFNEAAVAADSLGRRQLLPELRELVLVVSLHVCEVPQVLLSQAQPQTYWIET